MTTDVAQMRTDYVGGCLHRKDLNLDPFEQFARWMDACQTEIVEPNAMSLATATADGQPTLRTVLLKSFDSRGFVFFTNLESRKAQHIAANPNVSLLFPWLALQRQVSINGTAERISTAEAIVYFATRPLASALAAWASPQSKIISASALLEMKWEEAKRKFTEGKVPMPSFWGGLPCQTAGNRILARARISFARSFSLYAPDRWHLENRPPRAMTHCAKRLSVPRHPLHVNHHL